MHRRFGSRELKLPKLKSLSEEIVNVVDAVSSLDQDQSNINSRQALFSTFLNTLLASIISDRQSLSFDGSQKTIEGTDSFGSYIESDDILEGIADSKKSFSGIFVSSQGPSQPSFEKFSYIQEITPNTAVSINSNTIIGRILFRNGNIYEGETQEDLMHGTGVFTWNDGTIYEGQFKEGYPTGKGKMILADMSVYEGDFAKGYFHGEGVFNLVYTSMIYNGGWKSGKKHGHGWLLYAVDDWYEGEWVEDRRCGSGFRRYPNGEKYRGSWSENEKNGNGKMIWSNKDYYSGEWLKGQPHGYGEYIWELVFNRSFCFPTYNWYKGSWNHGVRDGIGVMNFGSECGSKYVGSWNNNHKHGPGIIICGNGLIIVCNPLFENDKPVNWNSKKSLTSLQTASIDPLDLDDSRSENYHMFQEIMRQIESKRACQEFEPTLLARITKSGMNLSQHAFIKLCDSTSGNKKMWCPLEIRIHSIAEDVDLNFYIDMVYDFLSKKTKVETSQDLSEHANPNSVVQVVEKASMKNINNLVSGDYDKDELHKMKKKEAILLKNFLTISLPSLTSIYDTYATFTKKQPINFKPVLIRLFLWQLLRDIHLHQEDVSLVETDQLLSSNPSSCVESVHCPFEPIYFYQFVQSLLGASWLLFLKRKQLRLTVTEGCVVQIFKEFLEQAVFPSAGKFTGSVLTDYLDFLPIAAVYRLYLSVGNPVSVRAFVDATCIKKGTDPPCYLAISRDSENKAVNVGFNLVPLGHEIYYIPDLKPTGNPNSDLKPNGNPNVETEEPTDLFCRSLYTFRNLRRKIILRCLQSICPRILCVNRVNVNWSYELTFLEFYEVLLKCAYAKAEEKRKYEEKRIRELKQMHIEKHSISFVPRQKDKPKRKKSRKSIMAVN